jgi:hypothetical protein
LILTTAEARRCNRQIDEPWNWITDALRAYYRADVIARATPPTVDSGTNRTEHRATVPARTTEAPPRSRWAFGPCDLQPDMPMLDQRGALRLPFAQRTDTDQRQRLGADLIAVGQPALRDHPRAISEERHSDAAQHRRDNRV